MSFHRSFFLFALMAVLVFAADDELEVIAESGTEELANQPASLKYQTPIAGTNLALNTLYKWHDSIKPGCYVTRANDVCNVYLFCTQNDQRWYETVDSTWVIERTSGTESMDEYHGDVRVRNWGNKRFVGRMEIFYPVICLFPPSYPNNFHIRCDPENKDRLTLEIDNHWLSETRMNEPHRYSLGLQNNSPNGYPYSFVSDMQLEARMYSFKFVEPPYGKIKQSTTKKELADSYDINNNSPATLTRTISMTEKVTNEYAWGFSESLKLFAKVKGSVGIPFIAEGEVETGFEFTFTANQNWKNSEEKTFSMSYVVSIPPQVNVKVSAWYDLTKDLQMEYTAEAEITGKGKRITIFDDVVDNAPVTGEMIRRHLEFSKFEGTVVQIKESSVITRIKGTMTASLGVRGQLNVDGSPVATQEVPK